jgi:hypothetical protein
MVSCAWSNPRPRQIGKRIIVPMNIPNHKLMASGGKTNEFIPNPMTYKNFDVIHENSLYK